jgi:hypothetical protein
VGSQPIQPPLQSTGGRPVQQLNPYQAMPNRPTYGDLAFGSSRVPPNSTYRIAPTNNRLQKNMYSEGYSKVMDCGAIDAFQTLDMVQLQECLMDLLGDQGTKMLMLISWCRRWPMFCKIDSALNLRCRDKLTHLLSHSGTTGWLCHQGWNLLQISQSSLGKMIQVLWNT